MTIGEVSVLDAADRPASGGTLDGDAAALARFAAGPGSTDRAAADAARGEFLSRHADAVYARLTGGRTRHLRLAELLSAAAESFPGLVPAAAEVAAEQSRPQARKAGHDVDQGRFIGAILRSSVAGRHLIDAMLRPTPRALALAAEFGATGRITLDAVRLERRGPLAEVTLSNPDALNAEDDALAADLETAVDLVLLDDDTRVGVLRGGPVEHPKYAGRRVFSAGINLKHLSDGRISFVGFLLGRELGAIHKIVRGLLTAPDAAAWSERTVQKPWIGAVDSFAIGGGLQLLLVLDHVIAEDGAWFSLPAADEGIVPGLANLRLTRLVGARTARRVILGGQRITTADPHCGLLCDEVVAGADMPAAIDRAARRLSAPAVAANRRMLLHAEEPIEQFREYLAEFAVLQAARTHSADVLTKLERQR